MSPSLKQQYRKQNPCSVKLYQCDIVSHSECKPKSSNNPIEVNVVVKHPNYDPRAKDSTKGNKATSTSRSCCSISQNVSYVDMFQDGSSEDTVNEEIVQTVGAAVKRESSHYRLVAHKYMLASRRGIISGPRVRTCASILPKKENPIVEEPNSDTTVIFDKDTKPTVPAKRKTKGCNKKSKKKTSRKNCYQDLHP